MNRRFLLASGAVWATGMAQANAQSSVVVVNVNAWDCPICTSWANNEKAKWLASKPAQVDYIEINSRSIRQAYDDKYWPGNLLAVRDQLPTTDRHGTPRWLIVKDGKLVSNARNWDSTTADLKRVLAS
jgi:hypothetical protein